ncbi:DNA replication and repair protein RecO [Hymenobacter daecheongensis DSM 21074]|uniref:DNA repair protein RecO n=1 Tax=Hymenobacter daecheongensis DSM 21074 TaxID=1121955 RepID=A0A1M6MJE8_9BACT|nr:DNA repair protein RecO [Hymenobacter daecheongensis]SHJ83615.1 DNA replication and repair protein RecO [Hymenobacter daecheongensis DSM 21074]
MLIKTRGIVLSYIKYRETSIIARVYTERLGLQTYIVNGVRKAKPPGRIALFQPFTLLDLVAYTSRQGGITRLSEYRCAIPFSSLPYDVYKSSVVLVLAEIVGRTLLEEEENEPLFNFLHDSILAFDQQTEGYENFALSFLLQLAGYLGFGIETGAEVTTQVAFAGAAPATATDTAGPVALRFREFDHYFDELLLDPTRTTIPNGRVRRELLAVLIRYYQLHVEKLGDIRSLAVLSEVLAE